MAKLLDLANELLLGIIEVVRVEDIEAFTSCNKRIYGLSEDVLEKHRAMKKKYSKIQLTSRDSLTLDIGRSVHPVVWLHELMLDEEAASYPTHLYIQDDIPTVYNDDYDVNCQPLCRLVTEMKDLIYTKLENCLYIQRKELERWKRGFEDSRSPSFDMALALLLTLLPNLLLIRIEGLGQITDCTEHMVLQIAKANQVNNEETRALSRLVSLYQTCQDSSSALRRPNLSVCLPFMVLPSIRSVSGDNVDGRPNPYTGLSQIPEGFGDAKGMFKTFKSGITNMNFNQSSIRGLDFEDILCRIGALQNFKYEDDGGLQDLKYEDDSEWFGEFQPSKIVNSLSTHAGHSLRCMDLTGKNRFAVGSDGNDGRHEDSDYFDHDNVLSRRYFFMGSLRNFLVLKRVKVDNAMFIEKSQQTDTDGKILSKVHRLVDILPASVEKLALVAGLGSFSSEHIFDDLVDSKAHLLPNLKEIKFHYVDPIVHDLKRACQVIGVEVVAATKS